MSMQPRFETARETAVISKILADRRCFGTTVAETGLRGFELPQFVTKMPPGAVFRNPAASILRRQPFNANLIDSAETDGKNSRQRT